MPVQAADHPSLLRTLRLSRSRLLRLLRPLLLALAVFAAAPIGDLTCLVEDLAGLAEPVPVALHVEESEGCLGDCAAECARHGCTPTHHHCECCGVPPLAEVPPLAPLGSSPGTPHSPRATPVEPVPPWRALTPDTRPPIA
jgi:hypothetical protein